MVLEPGTAYCTTLFKQHVIPSCLSRQLRPYTYATRTTPNDGDREIREARHAREEEAITNCRFFGEAFLTGQPTGGLDWTLMRKEMPLEMCSSCLFRAGLRRVELPPAELISDMTH